MSTGTTASPVLDRIADDVGRIPPVFDEGPPPDPWRPPEGPTASNARLGIFLFLAFEAMFFGGLIGAFLVFRLGSAMWPPPSEPYLPVVMTGINTVVLLLSAYTMRRALVAIRGGDEAGLTVSLGATAILGTVFLVVQGTEWIRLVHFGLRLGSSTYGATFYTLIGFHGAHVLGAVIWLLTLLVLAARGRYSKKHHIGVEVCGLYWYFVVGLWPVLYTLVYLV